MFEQQLRHAAGGVAHDVRADVEDLLEDFRGEHFRRFAAAHHPAVVEDVQAVAVGGGEVEVVQDGQDGDAEPADDVEDGQLVADVEVVGGFVQDEDLRLLGEGRAMRTRWRSPPERVRKLRSARCAASTRDSASAWISSSWRGVARCGRRPIATTSATVKSNSTWLSWVSAARSFAVSRILAVVMSVPSRRITPPDGFSAR